MYQKSIKQSFKLCSKSKKATVSIEYGIGLALIGVALATSLTDVGTAITDYMYCVGDNTGKSTSCLK